MDSGSLSLEADTRAQLGGTESEALRASGVHMFMLNRVNHA